MKLSSRQRWIGYAVAAAATAAAMAWVNQTPADHEVVGAVGAKPARASASTAAGATRSSPATRTSGSPVLRVLASDARHSEPPTADPFGEPGWVQAEAQKIAAAAAAAPPPPPPPSPTAPPVPYTYMGRWIEDGKALAILDRQGEAQTAKVHDTLDGTYRIESIDDGQLVLTYLPLHQRQVIAAGEEARAAASPSPAGAGAPQPSYPTPTGGPGSAGDPNSTD